MCVSILLMAGWFLARGSAGNFAELFLFRILEEMSDGNFAELFLFPDSGAEFVESKLSDGSRILNPENFGQPCSSNYKRFPYEGPHAFGTVS